MAFGQSGICRNPWNSLALTKIKRNEKPSLNHLVKHSGEYHEIYKASEDTFDDGENDMIENIPMSNEKEATNSIENNQNIVGNNH